MFEVFRFLDSMKIFQESIEKVAESLTSEGFKFTKNKFGDNEEKLRLMTKKGIYPYDYIDSYNRFNETESHLKDKFFSRLKQTNVLTEE